MIVVVDGQSLTYTASTGDWLMFVESNGDSVTITLESNVGSFSLASGTNFDNLATFIDEVKVDCEARGINWDGQ